MNKFVPSFKISANENTNKHVDHVTNNDKQVKHFDDFDDIDEAETIRPVEDENLKPDYLPPGYKITDFPKYKRVQGFDKRNPILQ